ncbi:MAG: hypothetical protein D6760_10300 [Deltaproteobacteria bacterium]|nr:MAG: hypothetical protein D6760_10300 [Deltaproteobacteria bacterium]
MKTTRRPIVLALLALLVAPAASISLAATGVLDQLEALRQAAVSAYNARDWQVAAEQADQYEQQLDAAGLPHAGPDFALVAFIGGHARFELWKQSPDTFKYDFDRDVLGAMLESLNILQDDPFFKFNVLGTAYYEKLRADNYQNLDYENKANWYLYKALMARAEELAGKPRDGEEYTAFAKFVLLYINRAFDMARHSAAPQVYLVRVREAARLGFGTKFDDRFNQLFQVVGFDGGNVRAGVLWQTGLDLMADADSDPDQVLETFQKAADATRGYAQRAEIYRQMADYASRLDDHKYKLQAVEYGRMAFRLDPENHDIQVQYGTSLHVVSYANYNQGRFDEALKAAKEATTFEWDGDEVAYFDLSRAQANFGDKINALANAERAYEKAKRKYHGEELQPFRQNYVNILRQFGLSARADQIEAEGQGS